eukprot:7206826-Alexandrium_andersonii.AAC.1
MGASLVGSEMCIRDRARSPQRPCGFPKRWGIRGRRTAPAPLRETASRRASPTSAWASRSSSRAPALWECGS